MEENILRGAIQQMFEKYWGDSNYEAIDMGNSTLKKGNTRLFRITHHLKTKCENHWISLATYKEILNSKLLQSEGRKGKDQSYSLIIRVTKLKNRLIFKHGWSAIPRLRPLVRSHGMLRLGMGYQS